MAPSFVDNAPSPMPDTRTTTPHPYAPLSRDEITSASRLVRAQWPDGEALHFKTIVLHEPPKSAVLPYLEAEAAGSIAPAPPRKAFVNYYLKKTYRYHEAIVCLDDQTVDRNAALGDNVHGNGDAADIIAVEKACLADADVQKQLARLELPSGTVVVVDPWIYGSDGLDDNDRMWQCYMYTRAPDHPQEPDSNHYAFPLPISPVISAQSMKVLRIDTIPTGADETLKPPGSYKSRPANEYLPESQQLRSDLKPLHVVQPHGASFSVLEQGTSRVVSWQKWQFRVGHNPREGPVLYNVRYDGRSLFHRLALSEMSIPYADPRQPICRKSAFDLGDAGAGAMANNLQLGCDCLGSIYYMSATLADEQGLPVDLPNALCLHEQDSGLLWKHTNYRTGRAALVRNRELVLQTVLTVSNYEYILAWKFNQAGELVYEAGATGILSTQPIDDGVNVPWGTRVHPGVVAPHHQHMFSLRIDPAIDGQRNRLVVTEAHAMPIDEKLNPGGTGYVSRDTVVATSTGLDADATSGRTFKIANAVGPPNAVNGLPPAYKITLPPFQPILSHPSSFNYKRAEFADRAIYVTRYRDGELYAGGQYTNQSRGGTGVRGWAARAEPVADEDIVVWAQFALQHIPRIEDFPVMPVETLRVTLKPVNFFDKNPALDVPPSTQVFNRSVLVSEQHHQAATEGVVSNDVPCCIADGVNGHTNGTTGHVDGRTSAV